MSKSKFALLALTLAWLMILSAAASAEGPQPAGTHGLAAAAAGTGCVAGGSYDPTCDVDHNNKIDVVDLELVASHWSHAGLWSSDNSHNHLGQNWTGSNNPLIIDGSFAYTSAMLYSAPLVLKNSYTSGSGLVVDAAQDGITVIAGNPSVIPAVCCDPIGISILRSEGPGLSVASAKTFGVMVGDAGADGLYVYGAGTLSEIPPTSPLSNGVEVAGAEGHGLFVGQTGADGIRIKKGSDDGIQIGDGTDFPNYGVYIPPSGVPNTALLVNTNNSSGQWALYSPDKIYAGNVTASSVTLVAVADGPDPLTPGDLVAASGVARPLPDSLSPLPRVRLADGQTWTGLVGVVESRMEMQPLPGKATEESPAPSELHSVPGPARAGDYVAITVLGVASVKVDAKAGPIDPGQRLTAADLPGHARPLRTTVLDGMIVTEGAPVIGIALALADKGGGTIPVFVTLR